MPEIANLVVKYSADTASAEAGADRVNSSIGKFGKTAALVGAAAGVALGGFLVKSIGAAANFEQGMSGVAASLGGVGTASGITEAQFSALSDEALRIGQTTSVGATDAARAMDLLAKAGVSTESIINGTAQAVVNVSEATGESIDQSASSLGSLSNLFASTGISGAEMADVIVNAMNSSDATLSEFQTGIANMAPVIAGTGMAFDESAGLISFFNSQGMAAAKVGSSLTSAYMNLVNPTNDMVAAQQALGVSVYDSQGAFRGFPAILDDVRTATEGMSDQQRDAWITQLFGAEALDVVTLALEAQEGALEDHIGAMDESGAAATAAATRMDNLKGDIEGLKGAIETASIRIGSKFLPALRGVVQGLTGGVGAVLRFGDSVGKLMDQGLNPAEAAFRVLGNRLIALGGGTGPLAYVGRAMNVLANFSKGMGDALGDLGDAFQALREGDFAEMFDELGEAALTAWDALTGLADAAWNGLVNAFNAINWGAVWDTVVGAVQAAASAGIDIGSAIISFVPKLASGIWGAAGDVWGWIKSQFGGASSGGGSGPAGTGSGAGSAFGGTSIPLGTVLLEAIPELWGEIKTAADDLQGWLEKQINAGLDILINLTGVKVDAKDPDTSPAEKSIGDKLAQIDWYKVSGNELSFNIGDAIGKKLGEGINNISLDNIISAQGFGTKVQGSIVKAIAGGLAFVGLGGSQISTGISGLITGALGEVDWGQIGSTLRSRWQEVLQVLGTAVGGAPVAVGQMIGNMLRSQIGTIDWGGIGSTIQQRFSQTIQQASNAAAQAFQTFSDAASRILGRAASVISSALGPVSTAFDTLSTAAGNAVALITNFITNGIDKLSSAGSTAAGYLTPITSALDDIGAAIDTLVEKWNTLPFVGGGPEGTPRQNNEAGSGAGGNQGPMGPPTGPGGITTLPNVGAGPQGLLSQVQGIASQVTAAMAQLANAVRSGVQSAMAALTPLGTAFTTMAARATASTAQMSAAVRAQFTAMQVGITAAMTAMQAVVTAQFTAMQATTAATMAAMQAQSAASWAAITAQGTASVNQLRSAVQSGMQSMASAGQSAMSQFAGAVQSGFSQAVGAAQSGVAGIRGAVNSIGSLYGQGFGIGSSFGQGIAAGLYSMLGAVQAAASAIVAAAASAAAAAGRIASPSKLMRDEIGVPLAQGVIVGLDSQRSAVANSFASLVPSGGNFGRGLSIGGGSAYAGRSSAPERPVQHVTIVTLEPGKWQEYLRKADNGNRAYQQQQPRSRELQLGTSR